MAPLSLVVAMKTFLLGVLIGMGVMAGQMALILVVHREEILERLQE